MNIFKVLLKSIDIMLGKFAVLACCGSGMIFWTVIMSIAPSIRSTGSSFGASNGSMQRCLTTGTAEGAMLVNWMWSLLCGLIVLTCALSCILPSCSSSHKSPMQNCPNWTSIDKSDDILSLFQTFHAKIGSLIYNVNWGNFYWVQTDPLVFPKEHNLEKFTWNSLKVLLAF